MWLWVSADGTRTVGEMLEEVGERDLAAPPTALMSIRRLRALGMLIEAGRASCGPADGRVGDFAESGSFVVEGRVVGSALVLGDPQDDIELSVDSRGAWLPGGDRLRVIDVGRGISADALSGVVRAMTEESWNSLGAFDLAAATVDHVEAIDVRSR